MATEGRLRDYSGGIAQIDEIKEKLNFRICPNSTIGLLASWYDMSNMRCSPTGGKKNSMMPFSSHLARPKASFIHSLAHR